MTHCSNAAVDAVLVGGNTNANTKNLEAPGPRIDPFQMMLNAKNLPTQELDAALYGLSR